MCTNILENNRIQLQFKKHVLMYSEQPITYFNVVQITGWFSHID